MFKYKILTRFEKNKYLFLESAEGIKEVGTVGTALDNIKDAENFLDQMSREGWELVTVNHGTRWSAYIFRHEVAREEGKPHA